MRSIVVFVLLLGLCACHLGSSGDTAGSAAALLPGRCDETPMACDATAYCVSVGHQHRCDCPAGTIRDGKKGCVYAATGFPGPDFTCDPHALTVEENEQPRCVCAPGWEGNGKSCQDIDECDRFTDACGRICESGHCSNELGSFACDCWPEPEGLLPGRCVDQPNSCDAAHLCVDVGETHHQCLCPLGFRAEGSKCVVDHPCDPVGSDCNEHARCASTGGVNQCLCQDGWRGDGQQCADINECLEDTNLCEDFCLHRDCQNTEGSYRCVCEPGLHSKSDWGICSECPEWCGVAPHSICEHVNLCERYECRCEPGYLPGDDGCIPLCHFDACDRDHRCIGQEYSGIACAPFGGDPTKIGRSCAPGGSVCTECLSSGGVGVCTSLACESDDECGANNVCIERPQVGALCARTCDPLQPDPCGDQNLTCQSDGTRSVCLPDCRKPGQQCSSGTTCSTQSGACEPVQPCADSSTCGPDRACVAGACLSDCRVAPGVCGTNEECDVWNGGACTPKPKQLLDSCSSSLECPHSTCTNPFGGTDLVCVRRCETDVDCWPEATGTTCIAENPAGDHFCATSCDPQTPSCPSGTQCRLVNGHSLCAP